MKAGRTADKMLNEILLVSVLHNTSVKSLLKCPKCKKKWFDSWYSIDGVRYCMDCGEKIFKKLKVWK